MVPYLRFVCLFSVYERERLTVCFDIFSSSVAFFCCVLALSRTAFFVVAHLSSAVERAALDRSTVGMLWEQKTAEAAIIGRGKHLTYLSAVYINKRKLFDDEWIHLFLASNVPRKRPSQKKRDGDLFGKDFRNVSVPP